jgi:hypothetical protein
VARLHLSHVQRRVSEHSNSARSEAGFTAGISFAGDSSPAWHLLFRIMALSE